MSANLAIKKRRQGGFSLLELAIVITIVGVMLYTTIGVGMAQLESAKIKQTRDKLDKIQNAITVYYKTFGSLPCPASGTVSNTSNTFGVGGKTGSAINTTSANGTTCGNANYTSTGTYPDVYIGIVPTKSLFIPDEYAFDAWGNRITYVVSRNCVATLNWNSANTYKCYDGDPVVTTANGGKVNIYANAYTYTEPAAYIIISHGRNGIGSWNHAGSKILGSAGTYLQEKNNGNLTAGGANNGATSGNTTYTDQAIKDGDVNYFDDIVRWRLAPQIYYDANIVN